MTHTETLPSGLALVFDLDGVIVDSNPVHTTVWKRYLQGFGIDFTAELQQEMYGKHNHELVCDIFGAGLTQEEVVAHGRAKEALFREVLGPELEQRLVPGIRQFLRHFLGVPMGVASNAERANVDFVLDTGSLRDYFQVILNGSHAKRPKPFPDIYLRAAELLNTPPENCIIFEDSPTGVKAGVSAGARVVGILTTYESLDDVDLAVKDFESHELYEWLSAQEPAAAPAVP